MRRRRGRWSAFWILAVLLWAPGGSARAEAPTPLEDGVVQTVELPAGRGDWHGRIEVPSEARALAIVVVSERDVDLHVRRGQWLRRDYAGQAVVASRRHGPFEIVWLTRDGDGLLKPGSWRIAVVAAGTRDNRVRFEVLACIDRGDTPPTLLPGDEGERVVELHADRPELRTYLPGRKGFLAVDLAGVPATGLRFHLRGPRDAERRGPMPERLHLRSDEMPAGLYTLDLESTDGDAKPAALRARARWRPATDGSEDAKEEPRPIVRPGSSITLTLGGPSHATSRSVRIPIREGTGGFVVEATNPSKTDVDLYVRRGRPLDRGDEDADYFALSSAPRERLVVGGVRPLEKGTYYCELVLVEGEGPVRVTVRVRDFPTEAGRGTWGEQLPPALPVRRWTKGRVEAGLAGVRWYSVVVPARTRSLHAVLLGASSPLDLVLARKTDGSILRRALTARVNERIDHVFRTPPDTPRYFLLGVMNRNPYEEVVDYKVALGFDGPPSLPADFRWPPLLPLDGRKPALRVAAATVELTVSGSGGGSGTCVTPRGRLLTCRHVLEVDEEQGTIQREGILVAFPKRLDTPPVQSFVARVTHVDEASDLALLELTSDIFGRPLARDLVLPWVPLGDSQALALGDPLMVFGYPSGGSERSRTPVILTRGHVAGLETVRGRPRWIKTDAWIGLGHSGGSMVGADLRLVGIPAATLGEGEVLGLAVPVAVVPEAWKTLIRRGLPR